LAIVLTLVASRAAAAIADPTAIALARCLDDPVNASTAGQTGCEATATKAYDARMNRAYAGLTNRLPVAAVRQLRAAQHAWLAFRDTERRARTAIYATRQGTMYVPMEAASETAVTHDRALELETYLRIMAIEP
jgi:uncharacterized protein YecT (DUF1311 family)